jgi:hypothetical protein
MGSKAARIVAKAVFRDPFYEFLECVIATATLYPSLFDVRNALLFWQVDPD